MRGGQHAGRAEPALQRMMLAEGGLQRRQGIIGRKTLDGNDRAAFGLNRQHQARADRLPLDDDGARAAHAMLAAEMGSGLPQHIAQAIGQVHARLDIDRDGVTVKQEIHPHHALRFHAAARRPRSTSVVTRPRR